MCNIHLFHDILNLKLRMQYFSGHLLWGQKVKVVMGIVNLNIKI